MKLRKILIILVVVGFSSACTQKFCPTYAKADTPAIEKQDQKPL